MEEDFYKDEFEQFLQHQANNHKMFPSDGVWRNIHKRLHGDNKWPALTVFASLFLTLTIAIGVYFAPEPNIFALPHQYTQAAPPPANSQPSIQNPISFRSSRSGKSNLVTPAPTAAGPHLSQPSATVADITLPAIVPPAPQPLAFTESANGINPVIPDFKIEVDPLTNEEELSFDQKHAAKAIVIDEYSTSALLNEPNTAPSIAPELSQAVEQSMSQLDKQNSLPEKPVTHPAKKKNRWSYKVYMTPSVSFRNLSADPSLYNKNNTGGPVAPNLVTDVNKMVRHSPGTGIEFGLNYLYGVTDFFRVKTGLQVNIRQYNIDAFRTHSEVATIALLSRNGFDSINTYSLYSNDNGYRAEQIANRFYQVAIPLGIEWDVIGNKNMQLTVGAGLQPTYLISKQAYILSTNYKNYVQSNTMLRRWNVNGNIEAFLSYKVGDFNWQLGPQIRYQHLPTSPNKYPIREHLVDYGMKIGVTKTIK